MNPFAQPLAPSRSQLAMQHAVSVGARVTTPPSGPQSIELSCPQGFNLECAQKPGGVFKCICRCDSGEAIYGQKDLCDLDEITSPIVTPDPLSGPRPLATPRPRPVPRPTPAVATAAATRLANRAFRYL